MKLGPEIPTKSLIGRLRLRPMMLAEDKFPERIRASTIASFWWCGWKSYATAILGLKIPEKEWMALGTSLHDKLFDTLGQRFPWETVFVEQIDKYRQDELGFVMKYPKTGTDIFVDLTGHPDDFQVTPGGSVSIIEYKTSRMPEYLVKRFMMPIAKFQAKLYPHVIRPTIKELGYDVGAYHAAVAYSSKTLELLTYSVVRYDPQELTKVIDEIFYLYQHPEEIKPCVAWKCKYCSKVYKAACPFHKAPA